MKAKGTRFIASATYFKLPSSQAPGSNGSPGTDRRISANVANSSTENRMPATAAARGVRNWACVSLARSESVREPGFTERSDCIGLVMSVQSRDLPQVRLGHVESFSAARNGRED